MAALECAEQENEVVFVQNGKARTEGVRLNDAGRNLEEE